VKGFVKSLLLVCFLFLILFSPPLVASFPVLPEKEVETLYREFRAEWRDKEDGEEDMWQVSPNMEGDCEDFVLTFYFQLPARYQAFIVRLVVTETINFLDAEIVKKTEGHIVAIVFDTQLGEAWVLDNGWITDLRGPFPPGVLDSSSPVIIALKQGDGQSVGFLSLEKEVVKMEISFFTSEKEVFRETNAVLWQK